MRKFFIMAAGTALSLSVASSASAAACDADVVFIRGSSASQAIIQALAPVALAASPSVKIVYSSAGSSGAGVYEMITAVNDPNRDLTVSAQVMYDGLATHGTCTPGKAADIGVSDVYPSSMAGVQPLVAGSFPNLPSPIVLPTGVVDNLGPVQAFTISVYNDPSFPVAISSEAAFNTFGITAKAAGDQSFAVSPWSVTADIFGRGWDSGTWQTWSRNLGLLPEKPVDNPQTSTGNLLGALTAANRISAIGIVALNDIISTPTANVKPLAFKAKGQDFAYYTSSTATATDMINVRDGHYQTWANLHFIARKDTGGDYSANVKAVLALLDGQDAIAAMAKIRAVPTCAMQVSRSADAGDFSLFTPAKPCGCFFETSAAGGTAPASCKTCTADADCGSSGQCDFGFCEAK